MRRAVANSEVSEVVVQSEKQQTLLRREFSTSCRKTQSGMDCVTAEAETVKLFAHAEALQNQNPEQKGLLDPVSPR